MLQPPRSGPGSRQGSVVGLKDVKGRIKSRDRSVGDTISRQSSIGLPATISSSGEDKLRGIQHLTMTIRHPDWWNFLLGAASPLGIDPINPGRATHSTIQPSNTSAEPRLHRPKPGSWGSHLANFPLLQTFTLELETLQTKAAELTITLNAATSWRFPLGLVGSEAGAIKKELVYDDKGMESLVWNGVKPLSEEDHEKLRKRQRLSRFVPRDWRSEWKKSPGGQQEEEQVTYAVFRLLWVAKEAVKEDEVGGEKSGDEESQEEEDQSNGNTGALFPALVQGSARASGRDVVPTGWG